jgi:NADPH2:quinone reductase
MRAVVCRQFGPPESLVVEDLPPPAPGPGQVVIDVKAASVNFPDVLIIQDKYQVKPPLPFSPGSEVAGVVSAVGTGVDGIAAGARVLAFTTHGGFAEQVAVDRSRVYRIPDRVEFASATALGLAYATSEHGLRDRAALAAGETLLVLGASGGVGLAAVEIGRILGARVIACASTDGKLAVCREHGADDTINYAAEDLRDRIKQLTGGRGVDVVYDPVGGAYSEPALRSLAWRGRFLVVGFAAGDIPRIPLNLLLLKGASIVGVYWGDFVRREPERAAAAMAQLFRWLEDGQLRPHIDRVFPLDRAADALRLMANREVRGKLVLAP